MARAITHKPRNRPVPAPVPTIEIAIEAPGWDAVPDAEDWTMLAIRAAAAAGPPIRDGAEVSVLLGDDAGIAHLNGRWRGIAGPTNVLSFPAVPPERLKTAPALGDIAIAYETMAREAQAAGISIRDHLMHLAVHSYLHLVGYDHRDDTQAGTMEALEIAILAGLGVADPYIGVGPPLASGEQ